MAVTHADLSPTPKSSNLGSKTGAFLMVVSILLGLFCFILCLIAEAARSQVKWMDSQCSYTGSGKVALVSAAAAFAALAAAMLVQHVFLLLALSKSSTDDITWGWDPDSTFAKTLTCQAGLFFVAAWVSFGVGEIQLLIGLTVESGHLNNWGTPRQTCLVIRHGLFTAAGVLGLATVFFASALYITALRADRYLQIQHNTQRQILEVSIMYASPPTSPPRTTAVPPHTHHHPADGPILPDQHNDHAFNYYLQTFDKQSTSSFNLSQME